MTKTWRTVRVYVDIAVRGEITDKALVRGVQDALNYGHNQLFCAHLDVHFGRLTAKSKARVDAVEERKHAAQRAAVYTKLAK